MIHCNVCLIEMRCWYFPLCGICGGGCSVIVAKDLN